MNDEQFEKIVGPIYLAQARRRVEPAGPICDACGELAVAGYKLYPTEHVTNFCEAHARDNIYPERFEVQIDAGEARLTVPTAYAGDYHSWVGAPQFPNAAQRGLSMICWIYNNSDAWQEEHDSGARQVGLSLTPSQVLLLLDFLKEHEAIVRTMANEDYKLLEENDRRHKEAARRADLGLDWSPIEE